MEKYYLFVLLAYVAEVLGTISGFGSSILFVPVASLFFDFKSVLGITAIFHIFSNLSKIALFRKGIQKDVAIKLGFPAIAFVLLGAYLTTFMPTSQIELVMNFVLVLMAIYLLVRFNKPIKQSDKNLYLGGIASGFIAGIAGSGGAIRGLTLAAFQMPKDIFIATSALIDLGVDFSRAVVYTSNGYFKQEFFILVPFLVLVSWFGSYSGKMILAKTSELTFRYIVLVVILLTTVFQIISYFNA